jgi:hypothetical protein
MAAYPTGTVTFLFTDIEGSTKLLHDGQVLLSETTRALVGNDLPEGVSIRDIGERHLKDVRAEHLYQLDLGDSPQYFPMLRTEQTTAADDLGVRISRHVESLVEAQLESVFAGGKPPTTKLAGLTALGLFTTFVVIAGLVGIGFLIKVAFF